MNPLHTAIGSKESICVFSAKYGDYEGKLSLTGDSFLHLNPSRFAHQEPPENWRMTTKLFPHDEIGLAIAMGHKNLKEETKLIPSLLNVPLLIVERHMPLFTPDRTAGTVFFSEKHAKAWNASGQYFIIKPCVNTKRFQPVEKINTALVSAKPEYEKDDWTYGVRLRNMVLQNASTKILFAKHYTNSFDLLLGQTKVYVNTTYGHALPQQLLEAMSCGCAVVTFNTGIISEFVRDGETGILADTVEDAVDAVKRLSQDKSLCKKLGENARALVNTEAFGEATFLESWRKIIYETKFSIQ